MVDNIVIAVDFNDEIKKLVRYSAWLANQFQAKVWMIHITAADPGYMGFEVGVAPEFIIDTKASRLREEHKLLQHYARSLENKGVECETLLLQGQTVDLILNKAREISADLIVMGSHEHSFLYDALVGNTCIDLFKKSSIPVLILPMDE